MPATDFSALENIELAACADFYRAAPDAIRQLLDIDVHPVHSAVCLSCRELEPTLVFRRVLGLGIRAPATVAELDDVIAYMQSRALRYSIPVAPVSRPAGLPSWLEAREFVRTYA